MTYEYEEDDYDDILVSDNLKLERKVKELKKEVKALKELNYEY